MLDAATLEHIAGSPLAGLVPDAGEATFDVVYRRLCTALYGSGQIVAVDIDTNTAVAGVAMT